MSVASLQPRLRKHKAADRATLTDGCLICGVYAADIGLYTLQNLTTNKQSYLNEILIPPVVLPKLLKIGLI